MLPDNFRNHFKHKAVHREAVRQVRSLGPPRPTWFLASMGKIRHVVTPVTLVLLSGCATVLTCGCATTHSHKNKQTRRPAKLGARCDLGKGPNSTESADELLQIASDSARGSLPSTAIQQVIEQHLGQIQGCYEMLARSCPSTVQPGRVVVRFIIAEAGKIDRVAISNSSYGSPSFHRCVEDSVVQLAIPQAGRRDRDCRVSVRVFVRRINRWQSVPTVGTRRGKERTD